jgi:thioredoxin 1
MGKGNMESNNTNQNEMTISSAHKGITLIDFWTPWCIPCKTQAVILNDLIRTKIHAVPTLCLLKDGKEIKRFIGVQPLEILMDTIARYVD